MRKSKKQKRRLRKRRSIKRRYKQIGGGNITLPITYDKNSILNKMKEDKIAVVGKVLGSGDINRKISVYALGYSTQAQEKLKKAGCEIKTIKQEIEKNTKLTGVKIL